MKRRYLCFLFGIVLLLAFMGGCGAAKKNDTNTEAVSGKKTGAAIDLYYLNAAEDGYHKVSYTLENGDDPLKASKEVIYRLSDTEDNNTDAYKASISPGIAVNDVTLKGGSETIDFGAGYNQLDNVQEALLRTSIVKSVLQIDGVDSVTFTVNGSSLMGTDKAPVGVMDEGSILVDDDTASIYAHRQHVKLYYANHKGTKLVAYETDLTLTDNVPVETQVLLALMTPPEGRTDLKSPLPEDFSVNQTQVLNNVCYVDLGSEIENAMTDVKEKITVYAMVDTLSELDTAYQVQFTIDGEKVDKLNDFEGFQSLLSSDYSLCK